MNNKNIVFSVLVVSILLLLTACDTVEQSDPIADKERSLAAYRNACNEFPTAEACQCDEYDTQSSFKIHCGSGPYEHQNGQTTSSEEDIIYLAKNGGCQFEYIGEVGTNECVKAHPKNECERGNSNYIVLGGRCEKITKGMISQCSSETDYDSSSKKWSLNYCVNISTNQLRDYVFSECLEENTRAWDYCKLTVNVNEEFMTWVGIDDKYECDRQIKKCHSTDYCMVGMHIWSDGRTELIWDTIPMNKSKKLDEDSSHVTLHGFDTWQDYNNYQNERGILNSKILNCRN